MPVPTIAPTPRAIRWGQLRLGRNRCSASIDLNCSIGLIGPQIPIVLSPNIRLLLCSAYRKSLPERVFAIDPDRVEPRGDRRAFDRRHDGRLAAQFGGFLDPTREAAADIAFVDEGIADRELTLGDQLRH